MSRESKCGRVKFLIMVPVIPMRFFMRENG